MRRHAVSLILSITITVYAGVLGYATSGAVNEYNQTQVEGRNQ